MMHAYIPDDGQQPALPSLWAFLSELPNADSQELWDMVYGDPPCRVTGQLDDEDELDTA